MSDYVYTDPYPLQPDDTEYELLTADFVSVAEFDGQMVLKVDPAGLEFLADRALTDVSFFLRTRHLKQVRQVLDDPEATENDRFVASTLLKNAVVASDMELPSCQDTGTAIVVAKKGQNVWTGVDDADFLSRGICRTYDERNLRYSQVAPLSMFEEVNTRNNMPAQIDIMAVPGNSYSFLFIAKGGGSANKTFLYQKTKSLLNEKALTEFLEEKIRSIGTSACPPYHLAFVIGGTSAEANLKMVKLASTGYLDGLPDSGNEQGRAFRDHDWEQRILELTREVGIGAQFGGKYFAHDVRVVRLPRHGASCPVGMAVSCSADRNIKAKITREGIFIEKLEKNPKRFLPEVEIALQPPVDIDLSVSMDEIRKQLSAYPVKTRLNLTGTLIVARDIAHARIKEMIDRGEDMPDYFRNHPVYYAGPAKKPEGKVSGSFGPTTAGRMDPYVDQFQSLGGSLVMLAKGNRSDAVKQACRKHGGFYLGSIGGPAAILAEENILSVECIDFEDLGMEAIWKIEVKDFPAFIVTDDKGNDFFDDILR